MKFFWLNIKGPKMKLQIKSYGYGDVISLKGELDFHTAQELRRELTNVAARKTQQVAFDFKKVNYIDSSGLAAFLEFYQQAKSYGGKIVFFNMSNDVRNIFQISKLDSIFSLVNNKKEALSILS